MSKIVPLGITPALLIRISTSPASSTMRTGPSPVGMSIAVEVIEIPCSDSICRFRPSSLSADRAVRCRWQPSPANALASPSPIPCEPPVIRTFLPLSFRSILFPFRLLALEQWRVGVEPAGPIHHRRQKIHEFLDPGLRHRGRNLDETIAEGWRVVGSLPDHDAALAIGCDQCLGPHAAAAAFDHDEVSV